MKKQRLSADQDIFNGKVPAWEKFCYTFGEFGQNLLIAFGSGFMSLYFLEVGGLNSLVLANLLIACKIIDALTDISMGVIFDKYRVGFAKNWKNGGVFRGWLTVMMPIAILAYMVMFQMPLHASAVVGYTFFVLANVLQGIGMSGTNITHGQILPRMTQNPRERNTISMLMGFTIMLSQMLPMVLVPSLLPPTDPSKPGYIEKGTELYREAAQRGYGLAALIMCTVFLIGTVLAIIFTKERLNADVETQKRKSVGFKQSLRMLGQNKVLVIMMLVNLFTTFGNELTASSQTLWATYYFGNLKAIGMLTMVSGSFVFPVLVLAPFLSNRLGKKTVYAIGLTLQGVLTLLRFFIPQGNVTAFLIMMAPVGIGTGLFLSMANSIGADTQEYHEWKTGQRADGVLGSISTFINKSLATVMPSIPLYVLAACGYDASLAQQPESAIQGIHMCFSILPAIFYLAAAAIFIVFYPLNKRTLNQMLMELKERRAANNEARHAASAEQ